MSKRLPIRVSGYFVTLYSPSAQVFKTIDADFKKLRASKFYKMVDELENYLSWVDEKYRERRYEGSRSLWAVFTKAYKRRRSIKFSPYPNRFANITNQIRTRLYDAINQYAIVISDIEVGVFRRNIYLLPSDSADDFLSVVDGLNKEIDGLRNMVAEYLEEKYIDNVLNILNKYNVPYKMRELRVGDIMVNMMPVVLDPDVIAPYISKRARREIEKAKEKIVKEAVKNVETKVRRLVCEYIGLIQRRKFNPKDAKKNLEMFKEKINSLGILNIDSVIDPLIDMCDNPEKIIDEGINTVDGKVKALLESL